MKESKTQLRSEARWWLVISFGWVFNAGLTFSFYPPSLQYGPGFLSWILNLVVAWQSFRVFYSFQKHAYDQDVDRMGGGKKEELPWRHG